MIDLLVLLFIQGKISFKELYMLLDEGTCLFNFDPHQVNIINLISQSVFFSVFYNVTDN